MKDAVGIASFLAPKLGEDQLQRWHDFIAQCPAAHFKQDPRWAGVECRGTGLLARRPYFFWCERDGNICLTAIGVRRGLPVPGRVFWEFDNGPTVLEPDVLDEWLGWLLKTVGGGTARLTVQPAVLLDETGDQMETVLDSHGFVRRRSAGIWSTLRVDLDRPDEQIFASFSKHTRADVRRAAGQGVVVAEEDAPQGWAALASLDAEMAARTPVRPIDEGLVAAISRLWLAGGSRGTVLVARHQGEPVAAFLLITYGSVANGLVLPSSRRHKKLPTSHLLLWEAMRWANARGYAEFDMGGYSLSARPGEPLWGVNRFKRGFAPNRQPHKSVAVHERIFSPLIVNSANAVRRFQIWQRVHSGPGRSEE